MIGAIKKDRVVAKSISFLNPNGLALKNTIIVKAPKDKILKEKS